MGEVGRKAHEPASAEVAVTTFYGSVTHTMDERGRVAVPARYRHAFAEGAVLRKGPEGCVELFTRAGFEAEAEQLLGEHRSARDHAGRRARRNFFHGVHDVELDRQGRVLIPQPMREECGLTERVEFVGVGDYLELWEPASWQTELASVERDDAVAAGDAG